MLGDARAASSTVNVRIPLILLIFVSVLTAASADRSRPNFVFICTDDLRPMLACYGAEWMHTPNIDALAEQGTLFERAYCQAAQCGPSRVSFMTGLRPDTANNFSLRDHFDYDKTPADSTLTLPRYLRAAGYTTQAFGKIFHDGRDDFAAWSVAASPGRDGEILEIIADEAEASIIASREDCPAWQSPDADDQALYAGRMTKQAVATLSKLKNADAPFFLAVGFRRPHLPFVAPQRYFDLYPDESAGYLLPVSREPPLDAPLIGFYNSTNYAANPGRDSRWPVPPPLVARSRDEALAFAGYELRSYKKVPAKGVFDEATVRQLRRAYMACVSYVDANIGRLLAALDGNTVVILLSDHGWHLGEHGTWSKMTNYEWATRVPLIISAPGQGFETGHSDALVELVDLYPTVCELASLDIPDQLEGDSLVPLLRDRDHQPWKDAAFSQFPRKLGPMGRAIRSDRNRYVEWRDSKTNELLARELYDHQNDSNELRNLAESAAAQTTVDDLSKRLGDGWKAAR